MVLAGRYLRIFSELVVTILDVVKTLVKHNHPTSFSGVLLINSGKRLLVATQ